MQKQMFKVITPIERKDGTKWWMRVGSAFRNRDESLNVYLDALPLRGTEVVLQIRELTEEDLRSMEARRSSYATRTNLPTGSPTSSPGASEPVPF